MIILDNILHDYYKRELTQVPPITREKISIVIPVKNYQEGIDNFLLYFFKSHNPSDYPLEIIVVDNQSSPPVKIDKQFKNNSLPIKLFRCDKKGAAAARNLGVYHAKGEWILFSDSDCIPTKSFILGYLNLRESAIAYAGSVKALGSTFLDKYYDSQKTLTPPLASYGDLKEKPYYIVTANAIVEKSSYLKNSGFSEKYKAAGGEDEDFSLRLWNIGNIGFAPNSLVLHNFKNGYKGFKKRFTNYGRGAFITEKRHHIKKSIKIYAPLKKNLINYILTILQFLFFFYGYLKERLKSNEAK